MYYSVNHCARHPNPHSVSLETLWCMCLDSVYDKPSLSTHSMFYRRCSKIDVRTSKIDVTQFARLFWNCIYSICTIGIFNAFEFCTAVESTAGLSEIWNVCVISALGYAQMSGKGSVYFGFRVYPGFLRNPLLVLIWVSHRVSPSLTHARPPCLGAELSSGSYIGTFFGRVRRE